MQCVRKLMSNPANVHYTMGASRWEPILQKKMIHKPGFFPFFGDCSSTYSWIMWRILHHRFGLKDIVNGANWTGGFTGTLLEHGKTVHHESGLKVCDAVIYGNGYPGEHVAMYIGGGKVFSHGSEGGPYILPVHYRPDVLAFRRYI